MTPLFVSLDKFRFAIIPFFFHQIDPKNGPNFSFLLLLCSLIPAFVAGKGNILTILILTIQV